MFYCPRCRVRFSADAATSALVCPCCHVEDAVFAPFTSWAFDLPERSESEDVYSEEMGSGGGETTHEDKFHVAEKAY